MESSTITRSLLYTYNRRNKEYRSIAQEVEGIIPEAVSYNSQSDVKGVNYCNMVGLLINAIKEQQEIIESQGKTIENILSILSRNNIT